MKTFLQFLTEVMMTPSSLPPNVHVRVLPSGQNRKFKVSDGQQEYGKLDLHSIKDDLFCPHNKATKGYGPFLYDLSIEYSTVFGKGVLPATGAAEIYGYEYLK